MFQIFKSKGVDEIMQPDKEFVDILESDSKDGIDIYLCKTLTDEGKFAYAAFCASILRDLYLTDFNEFCHETINIIINHLAVPSQVGDTIKKLLTDTDFDFNALTWTAVLALEPNLNGRMKFIIQDLIGLALIKGEYDARWRILILEVAKRTGTSDFVEQSESLVAEFIIKGVKEPSDSEKKSIRLRKTIEKSKRYALISAVAVGCGALVGLTGGLAAPAIVEGIGVIVSASAFGTAAVTALSSTMGTAVIASLFGAAGASLAGYKMKKRVGDLQEFTIGQLCQNGREAKSQIPLVENPHLSAVVAISGWVKDLDDNNFSSPWGRLLISQEQYYLRYETSALYELGQAMETSVTGSVVKTALLPLNYAALLKGTFIRVNPVLPSILLGLASVIDLPWSVCCSKAVLVGKQLAEVLLAKEYGRRPITLIGFSIGARVIYYCLQEMFRRKGSEGIIENVYLIGAPCPADPESWRNFTRVVSGTITNGYSDSDSLLKFLYRTLSLPSGGVAGLMPIQVSHRRIKNVDLSKIVSGHSEYLLKINTIMKEMNIRLVNDDRLSQPSSCSRS